ncbi:MAG: hypothetical protein HC841_00025 [Verrucomicrobiae bacterium]|nr:hypothetical protein [Verrucomicrobiae bacterium]
MIEAEAWVRENILAFVKHHEGKLRHVTPESLYRIVFSALATGYLSGRCEEKETVGEILH